jgi:hypothetical protein
MIRCDFLPAPVSAIIHGCNGYVVAVFTAVILAISPGLDAQVTTCRSADTFASCASSDVRVFVAAAGGAAPRATAGEQPGVFDITVERGRLVSKRRVLVVHRDDDVTLHITVDKPDEFHLHGYNFLVKLTPGKMATLRFRANLTGRFTYELHKTELELGALEVYP